MTWFPKGLSLVLPYSLSSLQTTQTQILPLWQE